MEMIGCRSEKPRVATDTMEESSDSGDRRTLLIGKPQSSLEDFPVELMHLIQSYILDPKVAARTCILSKSWLHAWSTIPTLRFRQQIAPSADPTQRANQVMMVDRTLQRYFQDNIPFETIDLMVVINEDSLAERWIRPVATRACVKELSLTVNGKVKAPYTLLACDQIFSSKNIRKIRIPNRMHYNLCICINPTTIKCVSLRILELICVNISEEVLDKLLSTCSLLEELKLAYCEGSKTIKVRNLRYLCKLRISTHEYELDNFEISDVPNLSCLKYHSNLSPKRYFHSFAKDSLGASVTELSLWGVIIDKPFLDMIKLKFRLLQNLTLDQIEGWSSESFDITCLSLKTLSLTFESSLILVKVQVFAPKLRFFEYHGKTKMPSLIFPAITPEQIKVGLYDIDRPVDGFFFVKMRETLVLPSNFDIKIWSNNNFDMVVNNTDFDDLRKRLPFPATNLQHLSVGLSPPRKSLFSEYSLLYDELFSICHPKYVFVHEGFEGNNYICDKLMIKETNIIKGSNWWADYLQGVEIKNPGNENWETLTDSSKSGIIIKSPHQRVEFKLNWRLS